ncbi:MAG: WYL domain-containing protein [Chloroflexi bacterium]|nr:WYL domain-containing protein [Chloroflexota bacterium]MBU1746823.1 WYL domain-containing protein [Chloroflexota bacterium]
MPSDPNQLLRETTFAILDVETTGLSPTYGHRVCEIACLRARDGVELARFESFVDPQRSISPGALGVNRITPEMLYGAPTFGEIVAPLLRVLEDAVLVAHNAPFDLGFLSAEFEIARVPLPKNLVVDTLALTRRVYNLGRNSLSAVAVALGVDSQPTHRAMADVQVTSEILQRIIWDLDRRWRITTLGQLLEWQGGSVPYPRPHALPLPPTISEALDTGGRVRMRYVDARGQETDRVIRPLRVAGRRGYLYLIAHCYRREAQRTFRLDRVIELVLED